MASPNPLTYSIQDHFGGSFSSSVFLVQLQDQTSGISRVADSIKTDDDQITVYFDGPEDIPQSDLDKIQGPNFPTEIGGLIAAHDASGGSEVRIFQHVPNPSDYDTHVAPIDLDYKTGLTISLKPSRTITLGEVTQVKWYSDYTYDPATDSYSFDEDDLVIEVGIEYERNPMGLAITRTTTRKWLKQDGSYAEPVKVTTKPYRGIERTAELDRRAENAIAVQNSAGLDCIIYDQMTNHGKTLSEAIGIGLGYADQWYAEFRDIIEQFKRTNSRGFFDAIQAVQDEDPATTLPWANSTPGFLDAVKAEVNFGAWT